MEVVYYQKYPPAWNLTKPNKMKRRSLMQRLSSWFEDHLPLRRRSDVRRSERHAGGGGSRRKTSKSVAPPRMRYSVTNAQKQNDLVDHHQQQQQQHLPFLSSSTTVATPPGGGPHTMSISMIGKDSIYEDGYTDHNRYHTYLDDMSVSTFSHLGPRYPPSSFNDTPLSQSFSSSTYSSCRRPRIRTNPWISNNSNNSHRSSSSSHTTTTQNTSSSMMFRSPQPSTSLATRSVYSAPDALSSSAAATASSSQQQQHSQKQTLKPPELLYSSMDRTAQLRVKSLDESTCSSGYGSQDSSPESSVHSPDWQQTAQQQQPQQQQQQQQIRGGEEKSSDIVNNNSSTITSGTMMGLRSYHHQHPNLQSQHQHQHQQHNNNNNNNNHFDDDEHVYHELESLHRLSLLLEERACSSEGEFLSPQPTQEEKPTEDSRTSSPIYAVPYDSQRNSLCSENPLLPEFTSSKPALLGAYENPYARIQPLSIESPFFQKPASTSSNYAVPFRFPSNNPPAPQWHCPPPPPIDSNGNGEVDFLAELDKQIAELQIQSDAVRHLVEQAKERQELRERTRLLCMEHINELRKMRWFMRNNFELCL